MPINDNNIFSVCEWLEREEFQQILRVAEYYGRNKGCSIFRLSKDKVKAEVIRGGDLEAPLSILKNYNQEASFKLARLIDEVLRENPVRFSIIREGHIVRYIICSSLRLSPLLKNLKQESGDIRYEKSLGCYSVAPYLVTRVTKLFEEDGLSIVDEANIIHPKRRPLIEFRGELREYQKEALEAWKKNDYTGVLALPMGSGKTIVALAAITYLRVPALIVVYTKEQLLQWREMIKKFTTARDDIIGLYYGSQKRIAPITITTYQTAFRKLDVLFDKFSMLIVDEAHHLPADKFRRIAEGIAAPYRMGLSATPYRDDGKHVELFRLMGGLVYTISYEDLVEKGYIAPYEIIPIFIQLDKISLKQYRELSIKLRRLAGSSNIDELVKMAAEGNKIAKEALAIMNMLRRIIIDNPAKINKLKELVSMELARGSKIIVFVPYVDLADKIAVLLGAHSLTGRLSEEERRRILTAFRKGEARVIITTTVGDEGIDVPDADVGILVSTQGSQRQIKQRLGRLLRPRPGKKARLYVLIAKGTLEEGQYRKKFNLLSS